MLIEEPIQTQLWRVDAQTPDESVIRQAADILRDGGLVAFPTETVYGLGANAWNAQAIAGIYVAKGRPSNNPLIVHVADVEAAGEIVTEWPDAAARLAEQFWPGPLTLVLPKNPALPDNVTGGGPTVGVRVPSHPVALALLRISGLPVAAPSANLSEQLSPTRAEHVWEQLNGRIHALLDGGATTGGLESTVLNLTTKYPTLLRPGLITPAQIEAVIGPILRRVTSVSATETNAPLAAPGQMARHYAPRAPLEIVRYGSGGDRAKALVAEGHRVGRLTFDPPQFAESEKQMEAERKRAEVQQKIDRALQSFRFNEEAQNTWQATLQANLHVVTMPAEPEGYAAVLYDHLHELDNKGVTRIVVDAVPETEAWLAIRDRLQRAATKPDE